MDRASPPPQGIVLSAHDAAFRACPHAVMERVRAAGPVYPDPSFDRVILTNVQAAREMLLRRDVSVVPSVSRGHQPGAAPGFFEATMIQQDAPGHARLRGLLGRSLTPAALEGSRAAIEADAAGLLEALAGRAAFDVRSEFAAALATRTMMRLLGIEPGMEPRCRAWLRDIETAFDPFVAPAAMRRLQRTLSEMLDWFQARCVSARAAGAAADLIARMAVADPTVGTASVAANCVLLFGAGIATTVDLITSGLHLLLTHPEQLTALRAEPERMAAAVEETLRLEPPVAQIQRLALQDLQLEGLTIPAGMGICVSLFATGCDPALHRLPQSFDIGRAPQPHLAFAAGPHACPGSHLARMVTAIAWRAILARFPALRPAPAAPQRRASLSLNGLERLDVIPG